MKTGSKCPRLSSSRYGRIYNYILAFVVGGSAVKAQRVLTEVKSAVMLPLAPVFDNRLQTQGNLQLRPYALQSRATPAIRFQELTGVATWQFR
jgi:hypothetical protein